jgi:hypothetical protein
MANSCSHAHAHAHDHDHDHDHGHGHDHESAKSNEAPWVSLSSSQKAAAAGDYMMRVIDVAAPLSAALLIFGEGVLSPEAMLVFNAAFTALGVAAAYRMNKRCQKAMKHGFGHQAEKDPFWDHGGWRGLFALVNGPADWIQGIFWLMSWYEQVKALGCALPPAWEHGLWVVMGLVSFLFALGHQVTSWVLNKKEEQQNKSASGSHGHVSKVALAFDGCSHALDTAGVFAMAFDFFVQQQGLNISAGVRLSVYVSLIVLGGLGSVTEIRTCQAAQQGEAQTTTDSSCGSGKESSCAHEETPKTSDWWASRLGNGLAGFVGQAYWVATVVKAVLDCTHYAKHSHAVFFSIPVVAWAVGAGLGALLTAGDQYCHSQLECSGH